MKKASMTRSVWFLALIAVLLVTSPVWAEDRTVKEGDVIEIHYTGKLKDDTVFDKSEGRDPLKFTVGTEQIISGMNKAVMGMKVGESKTVTMVPDEAYGPYNDKLVFQIEKSKLPPQVQSGSQLMDGQGNIVTVKDIQGEMATLDANHMLAGKTLIFDIKLVSIQ
ncbi:Peptidyl-prolyl cis-trans isomerase [Nitrospina gracilis 3/211]|uniref:Peptidyl-prolyl cis-trans isomerase n=1 Tax=Nitrospina gracilis (strain 3/211) TaxID=1266370 RepID=M1ZAU2_NITG3|nr:MULTISPECIES: peptidylprolyl isomerase [Nitrospina]MCF8723352.1 peptidylprolyl isomerase [Nitrospina sp. Nb-3]CCQ90405.1 Peptidyl-prolyl cis-trans isomerase [Nitrospina gracilis 3/211]